MSIFQRFVDRSAFWLEKKRWHDAFLCLRRLRRHPLYKNSNTRKWEVTDFYSLSPEECKKIFVRDLPDSKRYFFLSIAPAQPTPKLLEIAKFKGIVAFFDEKNRLLEAMESNGFLY